MIGRNSNQEQHDNNNHANQLNPNNDEYWHSRGEEERPENWDDQLKNNEN